jgi:hypothetical protein
VGVPSVAAVLRVRDTQPATATVAEVVSPLDAGRPVALGERFYDRPGGLVTRGPNDADVDYHAVIAAGHGSTAAGECYILILTHCLKETVT